MFLVLVIFFGIFLLFPIITTPFLLIPVVYRFKYSKYYLWLFIFGLSLIALRYIPFFTDDGAYHYKAAYLFQFYDNIFDWFGNLMSKNIPTEEYGYYNYPLFALLLYIFSKTGTYSLVSFTVILIVYFLYTKIIYDIYQKYNISKFLFLLALLTMLAIVNVRFTTSGMRYSLAVSILVFLFYKEIDNGFKLNKSVFYYLLPIFIHSSALIFVAFRFIFPWLKDANFFKKIMVLFSLPIFALLSPVLQLFNLDYLSFLLEKFDSYQKTEIFIKLFSTSDLINVYLGVIISLLYIFFYHTIFRFQKNLNLKLYFSFVLYICLLTLSVLPFLTILDRFIWFVYPLVSISMVLYIAYDKTYVERAQSIRKNYLPFFIVLTLCFIGGVIGNRKFLDFLRFVDFTTMEILTKNVFEYFSDLHHFSLSEVLRR
ncbi:EpsG family protein [Streptococcus mitis]|uniref:EpsG family protein n=1 Tax=Streptococcus mitis TaxID=28037 RepID=UPI0021B57A78|nr:EpsG family protein [Streptococcus mitis]